MAKHVTNNLCNLCLSICVPGKCDFVYESYFPMHINTTNIFSWDFLSPMLEPIGSLSLYAHLCKRSTDGTLCNVLKNNKALYSQLINKKHLY